MATENVFYGLDPRASADSRQPDSGGGVLRARPAAAAVSAGDPPPDRPDWAPRRRRRAVAGSDSAMTYRRGAKDDGCCSVGFLKCILHIFNFIFLLSGCAVLGVGVWTLLAKRHHLSLLVTATYASTAYMLVLAGVLVILVTIMGCVAIWRLNRCLLLAYTFLLLLIFLLEAVAGVIAYVYEEQVWHELADSLNTTFIESYGIDSSRTDAINDLQSSFKCCGANSYQDWQRSEWLRLKPRSPNKVPDSCCKTTTSGCGGLVHPSNVYYDGCINALDEQIREHLIIVGAVGLGICLVQVFGMIFSCCLYLRLRDYRRHPQYY
ncbi:tetraspanin, putative [Ixodes scapularis]|uniref:CD63 antigen n=1 Tax=Ixodes scapularis TaxID=6945 RepID=B7P2E1_IXOSC|nr:tetraspanin, putative [Ixodes scapularis]|eukprot:XP_002402203.1 tetraspanin, putative [Ixodes scapularis]